MIGMGAFSKCAMRIMKVSGKYFKNLIIEMSSFLPADDEMINCLPVKKHLYIIHRGKPIVSDSTPSGSISISVAGLIIMVGVDLDSLSVLLQREVVPLLLLLLPLLLLLLLVPLLPALLLLPLLLLLLLLLPPALLPPLLLLLPTLPLIGIPPVSEGPPITAGNSLTTRLLLGIQQKSGCVNMIPSNIAITC